MRCVEAGSPRRWSEQERHRARPIRPRSSRWRLRQSHDRGRYAALSPELGRVVLTLLAQRLAASPDPRDRRRRGLTHTVPEHIDNRVDLAQPPPSPADAGLGGLLTAAREAANWVEVAQARGPKKDDTTGEAALMTSISTWLRKRITLWEGEIGADGPEAPVAVPLPFRSRTRRLARRS